jgi:hypothetical protein
MSQFVVTIAGRNSAATGLLSIPLQGAWVARLDIDADAAPSVGALCTLQIASSVDQSAYSFLGTIIESQDYEGRVYIEVVGGKGKLRQNGRPVHFNAGALPLTVRQLFEAILQDAGETLAPQALRAFQGASVAKWTRLNAESYAQALNRLCTAFGVVWRVLPGGEVWIDTETWPTVSAEPYHLDDELESRCITIGYDGATWEPGTIVFGKKINRVVYWEDGTAELYYNESELELLAGVLARTQKPSPFAVMYDAAVVAQNPDGTLDIRLENAPIVDMPKVAFLSGLKGGRYQMGPGDKVKVAFVGASPGGAIAFAVEGAQSSLPIARKSDRVLVSMVLETSPANPTGFSLIPVIDGVRRPDKATVVVPGQDEPSGSNSPKQQLFETEGTIVTGSQEVFLR